MLTSKLTLWEELDAYDTELLEKTINSYGFKLTPIGTRLKHNGEKDLQDFWNNMSEYNTVPTRQSMEDFWHTLQQGEMGIHTIYCLSYPGFNLCYLILWIGASFGPNAYLTNTLTFSLKLPGNSIAGIKGIMIGKLEKNLHSQRNKMYHYWIQLIRKNQLSIPLPLELVKIIMAMYYEL